MTTPNPIERTLALLAGLSLLSGALVACDDGSNAQSGAAQTTGAGDVEEVEAEEPKSLAANRYTHGPLGFSIAFPEGWDVKKDFETFAFMGVSPQEGEEDVFGENVNVVAMSTPDGMTLEDFSAMQLNAAKEGLVDYAQRGQSFEKINGVLTARLDYVHTMNDLRIVSITFIQVKGNIAYAINCSAKQEDYDRYRALLLQIARSFRFEE